MSWRIVVINQRAKLDLRLNYLVVRNEKVKKVHLSEISTLIVASPEVSLTAALLAELTALKIKVIFCDAKRNPSSELVGYYGCHDAAAKLRQQIQWSENIKENVWTEIVRSKISGQRDHLAVRGNSGVAALLSEYIGQIVLNDATNREGHAAKVYFNSIFGDGFTRSDDNNINAALNYGYAILLSAFNREIVANGYVTQLGIHHSNVFNLFNLGSDLMEPFRPIIDYYVFDMWEEKFLEIFETAQKFRIIDILNKKIKFDGKQYVLNYAVALYCKAIFNAMSEEDISFLKFPQFNL